jgi:RNA polymerase sigma-70 factor (ECF subfamily)
MCPTDASSDLLDEGALVAALKRGDDAAFETLVRVYSPRLLAVARRLLRDEDAARDALQSAYLSAFRAIGAFEGSAQLGTWLHRIVVNEALMRLRSRKRRPEEPIEDLLPAFANDGHHIERYSEWSTPADQLLQNADTRAIVRRCIGQLPERYRSVLMLREIEELSTQETADALELTTTAVKVRLHRARQALATLLRREFAPSVTK